MGLGKKKIFRCFLCDKKTNILNSNFITGFLKTHPEINLALGLHTIYSK